MRPPILLGSFCRFRGTNDARSECSFATAGLNPLDQAAVLAEPGFVLRVFDANATPIWLPLRQC
jgi:hypothetical protein